MTDPNPIALLMLCIHLYQRLPQYLPKASVQFTGGLHCTVSRQVGLSLFRLYSTVDVVYTSVSETSTIST